MLNFLALIGHVVLRFLGNLGRLTIFAGTALGHCLRPPFYPRLIGQQMIDIGYYSLPVVGLTAIFSGMVLALQSYTGFARFSAESAVANVVVLSMTRELGPVLAGLMVAGRIGASMAAEMTDVTQRIAWMDAQGIDKQNVISGTGEGLGQALVKHPLARLITLTGSVRAGKAVFRAAADDLKVLRLELGGKAPFIVAEDANIGAAVRAAVVSRFENCGQICICNERMYLHERIADEFLEKFVHAVKGLKVGDPTKLVDVGPKFSGPELDKVEAMVDAATAAGAEVLTGGKRLTEGAFSRGHWFDPTVLRVNDNAMQIMQDEVFGPVVPVMTVTDFDEGLRLANESRYGLSAYVFTKDLRRMMRLVRELRFGEIYVNRGGGDVVHAHHAGMRDSGLGGEDGKYGLEGYFQKKTIYVNYA